MTFKILGCGTSTGVPMPGCACAVCTSTNPRNSRCRTSALITLRKGFNILIDTTTDLRYQALTYKITSVNAVLFTHPHADHILGLDDLRSFNFVQRQSIPCYATSATLKEIRKCFSYIFTPDEEYEGGMLPQITLHEISHYRPFTIDSVSIQPFLLWHGKMQVTGFRIGELAYATDCNAIPEKSWEMLRGIKYLILDGLRYEPHKTHFTIPQAIETAKQLGVERTFLIHMTHAVDYDTVSKDLPHGVELAYDGLEIPF